MPGSTNQRKADMVILLSEKTEFKAKKKGITRVKEWHNIMRKRTILKQRYNN